MGAMCGAGNPSTLQMHIFLGYLQAMFFDILHFLITFVFLLLVPQLGNI
jgi:hypothetical protein